MTLGQMMEKLDDDAALDAAARVNTRENVRLTFDQKVEHVIQEIVDSNFDLYKRITDDRAFGEAIKNFLFDQYLRAHRNAEELIKRGESKTLEFKSTLRWSLKEDRQDDKGVTHAVLKTIAAFLNTEGGDLLIGVADDGSIVGIERDQLESDDKFMRHLAQVVRNGLGDRAGTCIDPKTQIVQGKTVCVVSCQRSPEPVFLKWKGMEAARRRLLRPERTGNGQAAAGQREGVHPHAVRRTSPRDRPGWLCRIGNRSRCTSVRVCRLQALHDRNTCSDRTSRTSSMASSSGEPGNLTSIAGAGGIRGRPGAGLERKG